jgi:hypothetical protein
VTNNSIQQPALTWVASFKSKHNDEFKNAKAELRPSERVRAVTLGTVHAFFEELKLLFEKHE